MKQLIFGVYLDDTAKIDATDRKILSALVEDARISITDLARRVGLSKTPVAVRVRQMEKAGIIGGYRAVLSPSKLGQPHVTFVQVHMADTREKSLEAFNEAVRRLPEVEECYLIAGGFDYLLKVRSKDIAEYRRIMGEKISTLPHVSTTTTFVAMETVVEQAFVTP